MVNSCRIRTRDRIRDVVPKRGAPALFSLFCCCRREDSDGPSTLEEPYVVRDESGIQTAAELRSLGEAGFHAVLIGEHLMASEDPGETLAAMLGAVEARSQKSEVRSQN